MSRGENRELYHHDEPLLRDRAADFPFHDDAFSPLFSQRPGDVGFMSFADYLHGSADYGMLMSRGGGFDVPGSPLGHLLGPHEPGKGELAAVADGNASSNTNVNATSSITGGGGSVTPVTPNSSVSSSSTEAAGEDESAPCKKDQVKQEEEEEKPQGKGSDDGGDKSKKVNKTRKTGEKRQREARFAFMTKSEVDHLEDGYRWRKYGQKAVKNSPYPRSYYRCTTQKCSVKKRVERSYQDPTIVITTYEGQHTHQSPATIRGSTHILAPPPTMPAGFRQEFMMHQMPPVSSNMSQLHGDHSNPNMYLPSLPTPLHQQLQFADYGLLQDIVPSFIPNNQP